MMRVVELGAGLSAHCENQGNIIVGEGEKQVCGEDFLRKVARTEER